MLKMQKNYLNNKIMRLFYIELDLNKKEDYERIGKQNLLCSFFQEKGTQLMLVGHIDKKYEQQVVFEIYEHEQAYQKHITSKHFRNFSKMAQSAFLSKRQIELQLFAYFSRQANQSKVYENALLGQMITLEVDKPDEWLYFVEKITVPNGITHLWIGKHYHSSNYYMLCLFENANVGKSFSESVQMFFSTLVQVENLHINRMIEQKESRLSHSK